MKAKVIVTLKKSVLDPQGVAVKHALETMGYGSVQDVRLGKYMEVRLNETDPKKAREDLHAMCEKLLANPVIEEYHIEMQDN